MRPGRLPQPYPDSLTNRLPAAHPGINAVRETLQDCPHPAGSSPANAADLDPRHPPPAVQASLRAPSSCWPALVSLLVATAPAAARAVVRPPGDRRLVRRRPHRRHVRAPLLRRRDRDPAARRARLLERQGGHRARAAGEAARRASPRPRRPIPPRTTRATGATGGRAGDAAEPTATSRRPDDGVAEAAAAGRRRERELGARSRC